MSYYLFGKGMRLKAFSILILICFLTLSISQTSVVSDPVKERKCYGFIAPLVTDKNDTIENQINCRIRNMVNDLLREQIPVYWMATNVTTTVGEIDGDFVVEKNMSYVKGSFIIPFTGNDAQDTKLIAIIYDYNQSSEIEEESTVKIPVYKLMEPLVTRAYVLSDVKIAQICTPSSSGLKDYILKAGKCGFLNFDFIENQNIRSKLNNNAFNVLMVGGGGPTESRYVSPFIWDIKYKVSSMVRKFVANGGGYIGSCYGAAFASAGVLPLPIYLIRRAHNPNLPSIGILAISDTLTGLIGILRILGLIEVNLTGIDHPITYGLDPVISSLHIGGPRFVHIGRNSEVIARFQNITYFIDGTRCFFLEGKPVWVSSHFGNGKVILFSSHPEMMDEDDHTDYLDMGEGVSSGKTTISNALFYTTSKWLSDVEILLSRNLSFVSEVFDKTSKLTKDLDETVKLFEDIKSNINETLYNISDLTNKSNHTLDLIYQIAEKFEVNLSREYFYLNVHIASYIKYDLELYTSYFNDAKKVLNLLECIYPLLKNDAGFIDQIKSLKTDLSHRINETKSILEKSQKLGDKCNDVLMGYKEGDKRSKSEEKKVEQLVRDFYHQNEKGCFYVPQSFFNSLKLLRHYWYNYEASI